MPITATPDLVRILALPERDPPEPTPWEIPPEAFVAPCACLAMGRKGCLKKLFGVQRAVLEEMRRSRGVFGLLSVGGGKTLCGLLAPIALNVDRAIMLLPVGQVDQTVNEWRWVGQHLRVPRLYVMRSAAVKDAEGRLVPAEPERAVPNPDFEPPGIDLEVTLTLLPYSVLQQQESTDVFDRLRPKAIIADEGHRLQHRTSASTKRVVLYLAQNAECRFVIWSGTLISRSVSLYYHLAAFALEEGSPLPMDTAVAATWAACFDAGANAEIEVGAFADYLKPGEDPREGLRRRMFRTAGVVASFESASELLPAMRYEIFEMELDPRVKDAIRRLETTWTTPGGEELTQAVEVWAARTELLCGFYYRWVWEAGTTQGEAEEWQRARSQWHKELRGRLSGRTRPGFDSPGLIEGAMLRGPLAGGIPSSEAFEIWREVKDRVRPPRTEAVWIDSSWIDALVARARQHRSLLWFTHRAVGEHLAKLMPTFHESAGLVDTLRKEPVAAALSVQSCSEMIDGLQYLYNEQDVICPVSSGSRLEQLLGRLHRKGQEREVITRFPARDLRYLADALERCMAYGRDMGLEQKLLLGTGLERALAWVEARRRGRQDEAMEGAA